MSNFTVGVFTWPLISMRYQVFSELHSPYPTKPYIPINAAVTNSYNSQFLQTDNPTEFCEEACLRLYFMVPVT